MKIQRYAYRKSDIQSSSNGLPGLRNDRTKRIPIYKNGGNCRNMSKDLRDLLFADHTKIYFDYDDPDRPFNLIWNPITKRMTKLKATKNKKGKMIGGILNNLGNLKSNCLGKYCYADGHLTDKYAPVCNRDVPFCDRQRPSIKDCADTFVIDVDIPGIAGFNVISKRLSGFVKKMVKKHKGVQYRIVTFANFYHPTKPEEGIRTLHITTDKQQVIVRKEEVKPLLKQTAGELAVRAIEMETKGSGWVFIRVVRHQMDIVCYAPATGSTHIKSPKWVLYRKAVENPDNKKDNKCFKHCITIHTHKDKIKHHRGRMSQYKKLKDKFDFTGLTYPVGLDQIAKFERRNPKLAVTVFKFDDQGVDENGRPKGCIHRVYRTTNDPNMNEDVEPVDLLLIEDEKQDKRHYTYINNLSFLMRSNKTKHHGKIFLCRNCLKHKHTLEAIKKHRAICDVEGSVFPIMPTKGELVEFKNHLKQFHKNFVIYSDFETFPKKVFGPQLESPPSGSYTRKTHIHEPCSYSIYVTCTEKEYKFEPISFRGPDAHVKCHQKLVEIVDELKELSQQHKDTEDIIFKPGEEEAYEKASMCCICHKEVGSTIGGGNVKGPFKTKTENGKCRHHNHLTGAVYHIDKPCYGGGAAHSQCNLNIHTRWEHFPVFFHNLKGFDGHLLVKTAAEQSKKSKIIPQNTEKYISMDFDNIRYLDSYLFLGTSLEKLANNLLEEGLHKFKHVLGYYGDKISPFLIHHLVKKGFYPYSYMNDFDKFEETECFKQEDFYDELSGKDISDEDYKQVVKMWNELGIKNKGEWHDLYLNLDVLLLADVFENFRKVSFESFGLDPGNNSYTLPNFGWDCMLKMTKAKLELMTELDMFLLIEKRGIRGGISCIFTKYAKANNPYLKDFDPTKPITYISYVDANGLYAGIMRDTLPFGDLHFVDVATFMKYQFDKLMRETKRRRIECIQYEDDEVSNGYYFEVDLYYPPELHNAHNDYPMAVERKTVTKDMLSPLQKARKVRMSKVEKLIPDFGDKNNMKKNYLVHYRNLEYYLAHGLVVKKVHRIIGFKQRPWMRKFIDFCSEKRKHAKNAFEKDYFKMLMNSCFGKTMESVRKRFELKLITDVKTMKKISNSLKWDGHIKYSEDLFGVKCRKKVVRLNKPIYVGMAILELSKLHMLQYHYDYMKPTYGDKCKLLFTDTDSLAYIVETDDLYHDMKKNSHLFDLSNYPKDHFMFDNTNKKVPLLFKEESAGYYIIEFAGLKAKMYSFLMRGKLDKRTNEIKLDGTTPKKTGKGIPKKTLKNSVSHDDYMRAIFDPDWVHYVESNSIRSSKHEIGNYHQRKKGLNSYDDKSYLLSGGISQLRHNHYRIKVLEGITD